MGVSATSSSKPDWANADIGITKIINRINNS
jgi:hypothetical protein